ncbi:MAG: alpha/beta fold hydrolase [Candidatus Competibacteraceae bacterium]|jgi:putative redox protein|nr:alpha/beta fold hydrolase [Candidatus Competibacteraceae bacterium]
MSTSERVTFPGFQGDLLAARLDHPAGECRGYALFAHCFSCSKEVLTAVRISRALAERGIAVLRFDFTGLGSSGGEFANTNFSSNVQDLIQAAQFLREHYQAPAIMIGHSLGGAAVLAAAGSIPEVRAVTTLNAPSDVAHVSHFFAAAIPAIQTQGEMEVTLVGRKFRIKKQFLDDITEQNLLQQVAELRKPLLIFHSPVDEVVGVDHAARLYGAAKHPKSFISLDDADHMVSRVSDADFVANVLTAWASRYLTVAAQPEVIETAPNSVQVRETLQSPLAQEIKVGSHTFPADEPVSLGGKDSGPNPYDYLLAALGACTNMTLRMYAQHKGLPVQRISAELKHDKIHAKDCAYCATKTGKIDRIERTITIEGDLNEEQRARLLEIADRCPVHRTLHSEVLIETRSKPTAT